MSSDRGGGTGWVEWYGEWAVEGGGGGLLGRMVRGGGGGGLTG